jgi:SNARE protein
MMIAESKATGMMTLEELDRQKNQINAVDENVMRMEDNLKRADTLIKAFGKRMATDKLIQAFACINVLLIVGVVIYSIVKGGLPGEDQEVPPESPVGGGDSQTVATTAATRMLRGYY